MYSLLTQCYGGFVYLHALFDRHVTHLANKDTRKRVEVISLIRDNQSLWTKGVGYLPAGTQTLRIPFRFELPRNVLPSCQYTSTSDVHASVGYFIELVGKRPGILMLNKRIVKPFPVVAPDSVGARIRNALNLKRDWSGEWETISKEAHIRRGLWGEFSNVKAEVCFCSRFALYC